MRLIFILNIIFLLSTDSLAQGKTCERLELKRLELEDKYRTVGQFDSLTGIATVYDNMKMGYIDTLGKIIFPIGEYVTRSFCNGLGVCIKKDNVFAVNKYGVAVKDYPDLLGQTEFENGVAKINEKNTGFNKYGIVDCHGNKLINCKYEYIQKLSEDYYYVNNNTTGAGIINKVGDTIIPLIYNINFFDTIKLQFIGYNRDIGYGIFNVKGETIKYIGKKVFTTSSYVEGGHYFQRDGLIVFKDRFSDDGAKYALLNLRLDTVVPPGKYHLISVINEGLVKFCLSGTSEKYGNQTTSKLYEKCGFLNLEGEVVIAPTFDFAFYFTEGMSGVRMDNKWGFINKQGTIVIPTKFDYVLPFRNGYAKVKLNDKFYIINKSGEIVLKSKSY